MTLSLNSLAIVLREKVNIYRYLSGQEYYLYMLTRILSLLGVKVEVLTLNEALEQDYETLHLYYLELEDILRLRRRHRHAKLVYHVYHVSDATWSVLHTLSWKSFLIIIQILIDMYLSTARSVYEWIRCKAPLSKHVLAEPYYECSCGSFLKLPKVVESKFVESRQLKLLYIGRINPYRFPFRDIIGIIKLLRRKMPVRLTVISKLNLSFRRKIIKRGNITIEVINDRVSKQEKCELYREHHFFLYPAKGNVAMNPPITLLEAVYHGCIPIVSPFVLADLDFPEDLVVYSIGDIPRRIISLLNDVDRIVILSKELEKKFKRFYDIHRFLRAISQAL